MPESELLTADSAPRRNWRQSMAVYLTPPCLRMFSLGFSAGLPLLLVLGTLSFRLREAGLDRSTIGHLSWVALAYGFKWAWAPLVDRLHIPGLTRWLGRRRSWLLLSQLAIMAGLVGMATVDPRLALAPLVWCALLVAFASATQDIALDAYRIESAPVDEQPALAATYQTGYRLAMIWAGAGVLWLAARAQFADAGYDQAAWRFAYLVMAVSMLVGSLTVFFSPEPENLRQQMSQEQELYRQTLQKVQEQGLSVWGVVSFILWLMFALLLLLQSVGGRSAEVLEHLTRPLQMWAAALQPDWLAHLLEQGMFALPFACIAGLALMATWRTVQGRGPRRYVNADHVLARLVAWMQTGFVAPFADFFRRYGKQALLVLALIGLYRISDVVMGIMANPFYVDMGFSKDEVAAVTKVFGVIMTLVGTFIGGVMALRLGVMRVLMLGAILSAATNLAFAWLSGIGHNLPALVGVVSADNLASGIASAAFIGYLSSLTNIKYSATQYALFSSMMLLLPKFVAGFSGDFVDAFGYAMFFTSTALLGVPVVILVALAARLNR